MIDNIAKIFIALAQLISSFAWPAVILVALWWFGTSIRNFINGVSEGSFKGFGFEATARRHTADAIAKAEAKSLPTDQQKLRLVMGPGKSRRLADFVANSVNLREVAGRRILWVDDVPMNNRDERHALASMGLDVIIAQSTAQAQDHLRNASYDVVISDMKRPESEKAGYELLDWMKNQEIAIPFIIYRAAHTPEIEQEASMMGSFGTTNEPADLIILVVDALQKSGKLYLGGNPSDSFYRLRRLLKS